MQRRDIHQGYVGALHSCQVALAHILHESVAHAERGDLSDPTRALKRAPLGEDLVAGRVGAAKGDVQPPPKSGFYEGH